MDPFSADVVRAAYDAVAVEYDAAFGDELTRLPLDRGMIDAALAAAPAGGRVLEAGCGPAPAARHIAAQRDQRDHDQHDRDRHEQLVVGIDLSAAMLARAASSNAHASLDCGDP